MRKGVLNFLRLWSASQPAKNRGMDAPARRSGETLLDGLYRVVMRRTPVYVTFVVVGAFLAEQAVDKGVHKLWEYNNAGTQKGLSGGEFILITACMPIIELLEDTDRSHKLLAIYAVYFTFFRPVILGVAFSLCKFDWNDCYLLVVQQKRFEDIPVLGTRQLEE